MLRGYLAALALAHLLDDSGQPQGLLPRIGGSEAVAVILVAAGVLASVWIGRRSAGLAGWPRRALHASTAVLAVFAFGVFADADLSARGDGYSQVYYEPNRFSDVRDLFVYDEQGRLVENARVFDQDGRPLDVDTSYCNRYEGAPADGATYPRCPQDAPFRMGRPAPSPSTAPSVTPSAAPSPST